MKEKEFYGFVYITTNNIDGKRYIGKCEYQRENGWENYLGSGVYLKRAIHKHGVHNFSREIIFQAATKEELEAMEEFYIKEYNAAESPNFYNLKETSIGGDVFTHHPDKEGYALKKSINAQGEGNPQYNKPKTEKMINAVRKANSRAVIVEGQEFPSGAEASRVLGIPQSTIGYRLDQEYEGYQRLTSKKQIIKYDGISVDGRVYDSVKDASEDTLLSEKTLRSRAHSPNFPNIFFIKA